MGKRDTRSVVVVVDFFALFIHHRFFFLPLFFLFLLLVHCDPFVVSLIKRHLSGFSDVFQNNKSLLVLPVFNEPRKTFRGKVNDDDSKNAKQVDETHGISVWGIGGH